MTSPLPSLVDSHAHLDFPEFSGRLDTVLKRAAESGVSHVITIGISLETARAALDIAARFPNVSAAAGIHPNESAARFSEFPDLTRLFDTGKLVAVGETGLDFYRDRSPAAAQEESFRAHLELALARNLPVIIHVRDAYDEALKIIDSVGAAPRGVFHCFSGAAAFARDVMKRGFFISVAGQVTYRNADPLRAALSAVPLGRLLLETDCPFLAPVPMRGKDNEPAFVRFTADRMAELLAVPLPDLARATTANAWRLFGVGAKPEPAISYACGGNLYLNITNRCPNACPWCVRFCSPFLRGYNLVLEREPSYEEILAAMGETKGFAEVVFCGYGEPTERLDVLKKVAARLKGEGRGVRLDTNGLGSLSAGRDITGELAGLVDSVSVSLNTADPAQYVELCRPGLGPSSHAAVVEFIRGAKAAIGDVTVTAVELPGVDLAGVKRVADTLGAKFRARKYVEFG